MLDNLIIAYRSEFYDLNLTRAIEFYKRNKKLSWGIIAFILIFIAILIFTITINNIILSVTVFLLGLVLGIASDRMTVKHYRRYISANKEQINRVAKLLNTAIPANDLLYKEQVEELIERLSVRINAGSPSNKRRAILSNWGNGIVLPIIAYIAGVYATSISKLEFTVVFTLAISIILILGLVYITFGMLAPVLQKITCRDHDGAIALREDLLDIKLLFFVKDKQH